MREPKSQSALVGRTPALSWRNLVQDTRSTLKHPDFCALACVAPRAPAMTSRRRPSVARCALRASRIATRLRRNAPRSARHDTKSLRLALRHARSVAVPGQSTPFQSFRAVSAGRAHPLRGSRHPVRMSAAAATRRHKDKEETQSFAGLRCQVEMLWRASVDEGINPRLAMPAALPGPAMATEFRYQKVSARCAPHIPEITPGEPRMLRSLPQVGQQLSNSCPKSQ